jgi:hypothetical protein
LTPAQQRQILTEGSIQIGALVLPSILKAGGRLFAQSRAPVAPSSGSAPASGAPQIPPGSAGGQGAGRRIPQSLRDQHFPEGQTPPTCGYCRQNPAGDLDHVIPRSQNGDLTPQNIVPACSHCNRSKGARPAPVTPPANYVGEWPPSWWPQNMRDWWNQTYGGGGN